MKQNRTTPAYYLVAILASGLASCMVDETGSAPGPAGQFPSPAPSYGQPRTAETERPSTSAVPEKVIDDCLVELREQIPDRDMKVIRARRGEGSFIIDVEVKGVPKPWRCYHDGTSCTGTEYQGEG
jgi:hypothetical protein